MKTRYFLFLTSCLCGIALAFTYSFYVQDGEKQTRSSELSNTYTVSDAQALNIANRLVADRDAALITHDREALQALTVSDSPARKLDDALFETIGDVSTVNTVVLDVHVLTDKEWEVHSVQQEISMGEGSGGSGKQRCTLWRMSKNPWRLYETSKCG